MSNFIQCWIGAFWDFLTWVVFYLFPLWVAVMGGIHVIGVIDEKYGKKASISTAIVFAVLAIVTWIAYIQCKFGR